MSDRKPFDLTRHLPSVSFVVLLLLVGGACLGVFVYAGAYDIGADSPHSAPVAWLIEQVRDRSIAARARMIAPPADLAIPSRIAAGAGLYAEMCAGCHLAPGMERTEISQGLYPPAPRLTGGSDLSPGEEFWVIKHGVKLTGMAAWGRTHDDALIWDMVAFLRAAPRLDPAAYQALVKSAPADHDEMMRHMNADAAPMPGMFPARAGSK